VPSPSVEAPPAWVRVECPACGKLWREIKSHSDPVLHRVICRCKRTFTYVVADGRVIEVERIE
jgi:hypothetical protein